MSKDRECCDCCGERLTAVEELNIKRRRAMTAIQNATLALESQNIQAAKKHLGDARRQLTA